MASRSQRFGLAGLGAVPERSSNSAWQVMWTPVSLLSSFARLPIEIRSLMVFTTIWLWGVAAGLPVSTPGAWDVAFVTRHYFAPLMLAAAMQLLVALVAAVVGRRKGGDALLSLKLLPFMVAVVFLHFNFKAWTPLVNPRRFGLEYLAIDEGLAPVLHAFYVVRQWIAAQITWWDVDLAYHLLFVGMFFVSFSLHSLFDDELGQRRLTFGIALMLLLGGISYWLAPAVGPFVFRTGPSDDAQAAQRHMYSMYLMVRQTGHLPPGYFAAPLAAMPSLHLGNALFFLISAARRPRLRWLALVYVPLVAWIVLESVVAGWHYLPDLPAGAALTLICLRATEHWLPERAAEPAASGAASSETQSTCQPALQI
jgi:hypothetical protein